MITRFIMQIAVAVFVVAVMTAWACWDIGRATRIRHKEDK